jgi:hypothetical protein
MGSGLSPHPRPSCSGIADFAAIILATHTMHDLLTPPESRPESVSGGQTASGPTDWPRASPVAREGSFRPASRRTLGWSSPVGRAAVLGSTIFRSDAAGYGRGRVAVRKWERAGVLLRRCRQRARTPGPVQIRRSVRPVLSIPMTSRVPSRRGIATNSDLGTQWGCDAKGFERSVAPRATDQNVIAPRLAPIFSYSVKNTGRSFQ